MPDEALYGNFFPEQPIPSIVGRTGEIRLIHPIQLKYQKEQEINDLDIYIRYGNQPDAILIPVFSTFYLSPQNYMHYIIPRGFHYYDPVLSKIVRAETVNDVPLGIIPFMKSSTKFDKQRETRYLNIDPIDNNLTLGRLTHLTPTIASPLPEETSLETTAVITTPEMPFCLIDLGSFKVGILNITHQLEPLSQTIWFFYTSDGKIHFGNMSPYIPLGPNIDLGDTLVISKGKYRKQPYLIGYKLNRRREKHAIFFDHLLDDNPAAGTGVFFTKLKGSLLVHFDNPNMQASITLL